MAHRQPSISPPNETSRPTGNPQSHYVDFTFVLNSVTDQSKSLGSLQQELSHLKDLTVKKRCTSVDNQVQRIVVIETKLAHLEKGVDCIPGNINSSAQEIKALIESSIKLQMQHFDLKLNPISDAVKRIEADNKDKLEKLTTKIDELNQFRWKLIGITIAVATALSLAVTILARMYFK